MQAMIYFFGDDPIGQVVAAHPDREWRRSESEIVGRSAETGIGWAAIGGRYSGMLPRPGCTGRRFGDAPDPGDDVIGAMPGDVTRWISGMKRSCRPASTPRSSRRPAHSG